MAEKVGSIYYEVESDTSKLVDSSKAVDSSLDKLNTQFRKTDKAANDTQFQMTKTATAVRGLGKESVSASSSIGGLTKVLGGLLTLRGVGNLIGMAEAYNEMAERIRMATSSQAEYEQVQQRLLKTANGTYRALSEAQEVYILTADSLRSMGYSTDQALDIVDSLSYSFVKNAATTQRADSAISAFTKSIQTGKVDAQGWQSIIAATPTIINDIAAASGKTTAEIRKMGAEGKLTADMLNEGLRKSLDSNKAAADGMATTVKDAFTAMKNSLSVYVGEANRASGATQVISSAILVLSENIDTIVKLLMAAGAGALAKYIASIGMAAIQTAKAALSARAQAVAELELAKAQEAAATSALKSATAIGGMSAAHGRAAAAATAQAAATARVTAAQSAMATMGGTLLRIMGGPAGLIFTVASVAAGLLLFSDGSDKAKASLDQMDGSLDSVKEKMKELGEAQRVVIQQAAQMELDKAVRELDKSLDDLTRGSLADGARAVAQWRSANSDAIAEVIQKAQAGEISYKDLDAALIDMVRSYAQANGRSAEWVSQMTQQIATASTAAQKIEIARQKTLDLAQASREAAAAGHAAADGQRDYNAALKGFDGASGDALKRLQERVGALQDGNSEVKKAQRYLATLTDVSEEFKTAYLSSALAIDALNAANKGAKSGASAATKAVNEQKSAAEQNQKAIASLAQQLYEAGLAGDALAASKARASLNKFATPEEVANAEALAKAIYDVQLAQSNKSLLGQTDPIAGEQMKFQTEMENLRKLNDAKLLEDQRYLDLKGQAQTAHDEQMRVLQEENFRRQSTWNDLLIGGLDQLGQAATSSLAGLVTGANNGSDAVRALAGAILQEGIGSLVKMGIQYVKNLVMGQTAQAALTAASVAQATLTASAWAPAAAMASLASFGANAAPAMAGIASTVASTQGLALLGGRQYGGPVAPGAMHRINENGAPEVLNMANGRQYLLPNSRGEVVSNKDATQGGNAAPQITINLIENADRGGEIEQQTGANNEQVINAFVADIRGGGKASQALEYTYGMRRQGR